MTLTVSALLIRNGRYYFRISIPPDLKNDLKVREIKKRLRVTDLNSATQLCNLFSERLKKLFCKLRKNMIPKEKISAAVDECLETDLDLDEEVRIESGKRTPEDVSDPKMKEFKFVEVEFSDFLNEAYSKLECSVIQPVCLFEDRVMKVILWVDEEGLLKDNRDFFKFKKADTQWFAGNGMITCEMAEDDAEGNTVPIDAKKALRLQAIMEDVSFMHCDNAEVCPEPVIIVASW